MIPRLICKMRITAWHWIVIININFLTFPSVIGGGLLPDMSDKKIIISAVILAALLIVGGWYYSKNRLPTASISQPPAEKKTTSQTITGLSIGDPDAPVTIEEYTNFLCPACANFANNTMPQIKENYIKKGQVKMVIYIFPPFELAKAALCAEEQQKFVAYHDYLFSHQRQISQEKDIKDFALNAGLNEQEFNACYSSNKYDEKSSQWFEEGKAKGVDATPTFFINGQKLVGAQPFEEFGKIIDEKLNEAR